MSAARRSRLPHQLQLTFTVGPRFGGERATASAHMRVAFTATRCGLMWVSTGKERCMPCLMISFR